MVELSPFSKPVNFALLPPWNSRADGAVAIYPAGEFTQPMKGRDGQETRCGRIGANFLVLGNYFALSWHGQ
jgi:hypothetical protein